MSHLTVPIEASARHAHVTQEAVEALFGKGYTLKCKRELSMPGEFLSEEKIRVEGPRGAIDRVSILGPVRKAVQVEISLTDARSLGLQAPVRLSGDVAGSAGAKLVGPAGELTITEGVIAAKRHIHLTPETAAAHGISDGQAVRVSVGGERAVEYGETIVRVSPKFVDSMHIDTDEANAAGLTGGATGTVII